MVPPNSLVADEEMIKTRFPKVIETLEKMKLDKTFGDSDAKIGLFPLESSLSH